MSVAATSERPEGITTPAAPVHAEARLFEPRTGGISLEDAILRDWDELVDLGETSCPICGGRMHAASRCQDCGSDLS